MIVPVKDKLPVIIPPAALRRAGFKSGQELEVTASGGIITILPKLPAAADEYTVEQRRTIDSRLADGLADIEAGRTCGPFESADEMIAHMKAQTHQKRARQKNKTLAMKADYTERARRSLETMPAPVRKALFKQVKFLEQNLHHPSLRQEVR